MTATRMTWIEEKRARCFAAMSWSVGEKWTMFPTTWNQTNDKEGKGWRWKTETNDHRVRKKQSKLWSEDFENQGDESNKQTGKGNIVLDDSNEK
jgi:hypothetical protein